MFESNRLAEVSKLFYDVWEVTNGNDVACKSFKITYLESELRYGLGVSMLSWKNIKIKEKNGGTPNFTSTSSVSIHRFGYYRGGI